MNRATGFSNHQRGLNLMLSALLLSACGGSEDGDNSLTDTGILPVISQVPVSARDGFNMVVPDEPGYVDLSSLIESGKAGAKVISVYLESRQGSGHCGEAFMEGRSSVLGFDVTIDGSAICEYRYEVESVAGTHASARMIVTSSTAVLHPISISIGINEIETTNIQTSLGDNFLTGYVLSPDYSALGDGDVTLDAPSLSISYTATAVGLSRVVYALEGEIDGVPDIKMGILDYAVSDNLNNAPTAENFNYGSDVEINTSVDIDVSDYISGLVGGDELLLTEVKSYTANVALKAPEDLTNTIFTFETSIDGKHYVSYMVSDQKGGFAIGIVEVSTFDTNQVARWADIENGTLLFSGPETKFEIDTTGDDYQGFYNDTDYTPSLNIAIFTFAGAQGYCGSRGRLPTSGELEAMYIAKSPKTTWLWPTRKAYITQDITTTGLVSLLDGTATILGTDLYYVTCVDSGGLTLTADKSRVVANGTDTTTISVAFSRDASGPVTDEVLGISVTGLAIPSETTVTTDADGKASFTVTNIKAENTDISIDYTNQSSELVTVSTTVNFIGDIKTARVDSLTVINDGAAPNGVSENTLSTQLLDTNDNPVPDALVEVSFDSITAGLSESPSTLTTGDDGAVEFNVTDLTSDSAGETVDVTASYTSLLQGFTSQQAMVDFSGVGACGTGVNDTNKTNGTGDCLKVIENNGKLFTGTPSITVLNTMGYAKAAGSSSINDGKTYVFMSTETGNRGPVGGFGLFDQLLIGGDNTSSIAAESINGQYYRWCEDLASIKFNGRGDWRRASRYELEDLYSDRGDMYAGYGWATGYRYWSRSRTHNMTKFSRVYLRNTAIGSDRPNIRLYASCISGS